MDTERAFDKIQCPFLIKIPLKENFKRYFINIIKYFYLEE